MRNNKNKHSGGVSYSACNAFINLQKNTLCVDVEKHLVRDMLCVGPPMGFRGWVG